MPGESAKAADSGATDSPSERALRYSLGAVCVILLVGVGVRCARSSYDGDNYVQQVKHRIKHGEYKQIFTLLREGRGVASFRMVS
jgi:hypothetical protein